MFCKEDKHRYEEAFNESMEKFIKRQQVAKQTDTLKFIYDIYANQSQVKQNVRYGFYYIVFHMCVCACTEVGIIAINCDNLLQQQY